MYVCDRSKSLTKYQQQSKRGRGLKKAILKSFMVFLQAAAANKNKSSCPYIAEWQHLKHASCRPSQPFYLKWQKHTCAYLYFHTWRPNSVRAVNWGPELEKKIPPCDWNALQTVQYKADLFSFEGHSFFFLEGAAVNHEWQWCVIITSLCQILQIPDLSPSISLTLYN